MKKNKKLYVLLAFLIVIFTMSIVEKTMQNDTFFYIPIGKYIAQTHTIDGLDHWSFHSDLKFMYPGWICKLGMYLLYTAFGFTGIYVCVLITSAMIAIIFFNTLLKEKHTLWLSFLVTLIAIVFGGRHIFCARNQLFSFFCFSLEYYCLQGLMERGEKKYFWFLILVAFILLNVHDTVYPIFFVLLLPYLFEVVVSKCVRLGDTAKIQYSDLKNKKYIVLLFLIAIFVGFCTPIFGTAYTNLLSAVDGVGVQFIAEMQPVNIMMNIPIIFMVSLLFGILCFTKTKVKLKDLLFTVGFLIMGSLNYRSYPFILMIGGITCTNIFSSFLRTYITEEKIELFSRKLDSSKLWITVVFCMLSIFSIYLFSEQAKKQYVDDLTYPIAETDYILRKLDYKNIRIWTHYNFGSYLELYGIPVFIDSRAEMFIEQMNEGCTVLEDWINTSDGKVHYKQTFEKYGITHVLVYNTETINLYLQEDTNYRLLYRSTIFSLYEKEESEE